MKKAIAFVVLILSIYFFVLITSPAAAIQFFFCTKKALKKPTGYSLKVFIAYDQLINTVFAPLLNSLFRPVFRFGFPDETISSVIGKNISLVPNKTDKALFIIDEWLSKIDKHSNQHSVDAIEKDEGDENAI